MINRNVTAFEVGASLAADLILKFAERDMSPEQRTSLVEYATDLADRFIRRISTEGHAPVNAISNREQT